ncbi:hypothetical protein P22_0549 [Propionispora sp. 2/2-37]|uniref:tyrosine-protein phosphatase n=1 Tax=Propionispora sp. 2/2-37 TaxID=1677858 RepID=UPI0006BB975C|nr:CpsB/CapC family capsule biosynthesis tyrosine phosphatase [Propionispora sp. 2/2-37]CUH94483.1 hypothetical protein P22_0549 [Propionispora sp. 2/2-37]
MFDMHSHILSGIDDGAKDLDTSLTMLRMAQESGTRHIVATPHVIEGKWLPSWERIIAGCEQVKQAAEQEGLSIEIYPGGEVAVYMDILKEIQGPGPYCINGGRYLLVELPAMEIPSFTEEFFFRLQTRGITPILAHPERHPRIAGNPNRLAEWIRAGVLVQVNGASITGRFGKKAMETAELLLKSNMVHCIGSDAHSAHTRNPRLGEVRQKIGSIVGQENVARLTRHNPANMIHSRDVDIPEIKLADQSHKPGAITKMFRMLWG